MWDAKVLACLVEFNGHKRRFTQFYRVVPRNGHLIVIRFQNK